MTSFWPGTEKRKISQPRNLYPDATFTPIHLLVKFCDDRTSGKWSKSGNGRTDGRPNGRLQDFVYEATQIDTPTNFEKILTNQITKP